MKNEKTATFCNHLISNVANKQIILLSKTIDVLGNSEA